MNENVKTKPKPVTRVDTLTPEQEAQLAPWAEKWIARGLCTDPAPRAEVEAGIARCRSAAKLPPAPVFWASNPEECITAAIAAACVLVNPSTYNGLPANKTRKGLPQAAALTRTIIESINGGNASGAVYEAFLGRGKEHTRANIAKSWTSYLGGQFWVAWSAYERFFAEVCGLVLPDDLTERGAAYAETTKAGWWMVHELFTVVTERPNVLTRNAAGQLHNSTGPAIAWGDYQLHFLQGVRVPANWVTGDVDPKLALTHTNVEERRVLREHLGWAKIMTVIPHRTVHKDPDPLIGEVVECDLGRELGGTARFLKALCPARSTFIFERIDPSCDTAISAQLWRNPSLGGVYDLDFRT